MKKEYNYRVEKIVEIMETTVAKTHYGLIAETLVKNVKGQDWIITTMKRHGGIISCVGQAGKLDVNGFIYTYQSDSILLSEGEPKTRATENNIRKIHSDGLTKFKSEIL